MRKYVAMWALPGCIPEMEPARFGALYEAQDFLESEFQMQIESECEGDCKPKRIHDWEDLLYGVRQLSGDHDLTWHGTGPDGYVYSLSIAYP